MARKRFPTETPLKRHEIRGDLNVWRQAVGSVEIHMKTWQGGTTTFTPDPGYNPRKKFGIRMITLGCGLSFLNELFH